MQPRLRGRQMAIERMLHGGPDTQRIFEAEHHEREEFDGEKDTADSRAANAGTDSSATVMRLITTRRMITASMRRLTQSPKPTRFQQPRSSGGAIRAEAYSINRPRASGAIAAPFGDIVIAEDAQRGPVEIIVLAGAQGPQEGTSPVRPSASAIGTR